MLGDLPGAQSVATPRKQGQHLGLCRIDSGRTAGGPEFGTKHQCNALETFNEPGRDRVGNRSVIHKEWIGLLTNGVNSIFSQSPVRPLLARKIPFSTSIKEC